MRLIETFDVRGRSLAEADSDSADPWLFYVAVKDATASPQPYREAAAESK
jgi:hypothetical protein